MSAPLDPSEIARLVKHLSRAELAELDRLLAQEGPSQGLQDFIPTLNRRYTSPKHLSPFTGHLERAWTEPVRVTASAPPRHGKTESILAYIALTLRRYPHRTIAYVTYEAHTAQSKSRKARAWAEQVGVKLSETNKIGEWRTTQGGGLLATGIGGPLTGHGVDILIVDDPYKNRIDAESHSYRSMVQDWWSDVAETRIEPGGSAFVIHTRWHTDDLISHLSGEPWEHVRLPALSDLNEPLWPERFSLDALIEKRKAVGEYTWASLYQGDPRPRSGQLFRGLRHYTTLPQTYQVGIGVDLAYTSKTQSDHSVAVVLAEHDATWFVLDVIRKQVAAPDFAQTLKTLQQRYPSAPMRWYASGTEIGSADFIKRLGVNLSVRNATGDKYIRAQPVSAQWNEGKILVPEQAPWLEEFGRVVTSFTGVGDAEDDDVDALAAAFDQLVAEPIQRGPRPGSDEWAKAEQARMLEQAREGVQARLRERQFRSQWDS